MTSDLLKWIAIDINNFTSLRWKWVFNNGFVQLAHHLLNESHQLRYFCHLKKKHVIIALAHALIGNVE